MYIFPLVVLELLLWIWTYPCLLGEIYQENIYLFQVKNGTVEQGVKYVQSQQ